MSSNKISRRQNEMNTAYGATALLQSAGDVLSHYYDWIIRKIVNDAPLGREAKVLDFGAGVGQAAEIYYRMTGIRPDCLEIDDRQRAIIEAKGFKVYPCMEAITDKYDLIFSSNVLEHIADDVSALKLLRTRLSATGKLIVYVPAFMSLWTAMDERVGHYRRYSKDTATEKLSQSGFKAVKIRYCDSVGFLLSLAFKYLGDKRGEPSMLSLRLFDNVLLPLSKALDMVTHRWFGKNIYFVAVSR